MSKLGRLWAGYFYGTNTGKVYLELSETDPELIGTLRLMDSEFGVAVYAVKGSAGDTTSISGVPVSAADGVQLGELRAEVSLSSDGSLRGKWSTSIGTAGTLQLFPHDHVVGSEGEPTGGAPEQLYTKDIQLGAVRLFADDVKRLLAHVRKDLVAGRTVVTVRVRGGEVSKYAEDFVQDMPGLGRLDYLKIFLQEPEAHGINRVVLIELNSVGENTIRVQGMQESWVLGKAASIEAVLRQYQRALITTYRKFGLNLNQFIFMAMLVMMPGIAEWQGRAVFAVAVWVLLWAMLFLHRQFIPNALIQFGDAAPSLVRRAMPTVVSWLVGASSSLIAAWIFYLLTRDGS